MTTTCESKHAGFGSGWNIFIQFALCAHAFIMFVCVIFGERIRIVFFVSTYKCCHENVLELRNPKKFNTWFTKTIENKNIYVGDFELQYFGRIYGTTFAYNFKTLVWLFLAHWMSHHIRAILTWDMALRFNYE